MYLILKSILEILIETLIGYWFYSEKLRAKWKNTWSKPLFIHGLYLWHFNHSSSTQMKGVVRVEVYNVHRKIVTIHCRDGPAARSNRMSRPALRSQLRLKTYLYNIFLIPRKLIWRVYCLPFAAPSLLVSFSELIVSRKWGRLCFLFPFQ